MGDISNEPSMEDILSSIKRIIADDAEKALSEPKAPRRAPVRPAVFEELANRAPKPEPETLEAETDDVFELTERAPFEPEAEPDMSIVSESAAEASRHALQSLSTLVVKPQAPGSDTLEGMVRDMLRPMLKEWLDTNLPAVVESLVSKEIARIAGNSAG